MASLGPYTLKRQLARDAIVEVFLARNENVPGSRPVVIKRMRRDRAHDPARVERFLENARIASLFNHPNLVPVREILDDQLAVVMEAVDGWPVSDLICRSQMRGRHIPYDIATSIVAEVADGLHFAHELCGADGELLGLVHGNVQPANVMVMRSGAVRLVNLTLIDADLPDEEVSGLTYLSPEGVLNRPLDQRSDVFGLGVVFYELLTLHPCFAREDPVETLDAIFHTRYRPAQQWRSSLPLILRAALECMLERQPNDRYASAAETSIALWQFLVDQKPVTAARLKRFTTELTEATEVTDDPAPAGPSHHELVTVEMESSWLRDVANRSKSPGNGGGADAKPPALPPGLDQAVVDVLAAVDLENLNEDWTVSSGPRLAIPRPRATLDREVWRVHERGRIRNPGNLGSN